MQTVRDIVTDALSIARIVGLGRTPKAKEMTFGVQALNDMLSQWVVEGIDLEQSELVESDEPTFDATYLRGVKYNLAAALAEGPWGGEMSQGALNAATEGKMFIRNAVSVMEPFSFENGEPATRIGWFD